MTSSDYIKFGPPNSRSFSELYRSANEELLKPFPSTPIADFPILNELTGGLRAREFTILCGATGVGKTTLLANLSRSFLKSKVPHFVASVETGPNDFLKRVMSCFLEKDINQGNQIDVSELKLIARNWGDLMRTDQAHLSLYENRFSVERLMNDIASMVEGHGCKVAMIDNLNFFMEVTRAADQIVEMDRVIHELIIFCKQVDVHVIMVMHPRKTENGRVESEFDIKGSSTAVQESHNIILFNRLKKEMLDGSRLTENDREVKIAKMRRRGLAVGTSIVLKTPDGVSYREGGRFRES